MGRILREVAKSGQEHKMDAYHARQDIAERKEENHAPVAKPTQITAYNLETREPGDLQLNTALMLDIAHGVLKHWARWRMPEYIDIAAGWVASTWMVDTSNRLLFNAHGRFGLVGPMGTGKTRTMKLMRGMSRMPTGIVKAPITAPGLRDALDMGYTVFLDELDRQFGRGGAHLDVQSLVSAYEKDTGSLNGIGGLNQQNIYGPMVFGAKPRILTGTNGMVEDLLERAFVVTPVKADDPNDIVPDLDEAYDRIIAKVPGLFAMWGETVRYEMAESGANSLWPIHSIPKALTARQREISLPLLAVADRAVDPDMIAAHGSDLRWAMRMREATQAVLLDRGNDGAQILADVKKDMRKLGIKL